MQPEFSLNCCNYRIKSIKTGQVCARVFVAFTKYVTCEMKGSALDHRLSISNQMPKRRLHGADNLVGMHFGYISQLQSVTFVINQQTIKTILSQSYGEPVFFSHSNWSKLLSVVSCPGG